MEIEWEYVHGIHKQQRDLYIYYIIWLVVDLPLGKICVSNSWDDEIPNIWEVIKFMFQTTNQIHIYYTHHINPS